MRGSAEERQSHLGLLLHAALVVCDVLCADGECGLQGLEGACHAPGAIPCDCSGYLCQDLLQSLPPSL